MTLVGDIFFFRLLLLLLPPLLKNDAIDFDFMPFFLGVLALALALLLLVVLLLVEPAMV